MAMSYSVNKAELVSKLQILDGLTNEERSNLIALLREQKKYGLVWEDSTEDAWEMMKDNIPVLKEDETKQILHGSENPNHILIEGDNLNALTALSYTHEGKIDVIYIDPPYNTGNNDFVYNDKFIGEDDSYRHSKWLSFMEKRLKIAKTLLSEKGVIFISIDDNEQANVELLCNEVFGEKNRISKLPRITKSSGKTTDKIAQNHDYILFYAKNIDQVIVTGLPHDDEGFRYSDEYETSRGRYKLNQTLDYDSLSYSDGLDYPITIEGITLYPGGSYEKFLERKAGNHRRADWAWRWSPDLYDFGLKNGFVVLKKSKNGYRIYTKTYQYASIVKDSDEYKVDYKERTKPIQSIDFIDNIFSNDNAKKELGKLFNPIPFDYPKPTSIMNMLLRIIPHSSTILDFFAGSGTTMHATMQLNKEDGGRRQCILVTNNENNICEEVTYERNKRVIEGYTTPKGEKVEGLKDNNLRYYKIDFKERKQSHQSNRELCHNMKDLLCIKEDIYQEQHQFGSLPLKGKERMIRYFAENGREMLMVYDTRVIPFIVKEIEKMSEKEQPLKIYIFADGAYPYTDDFATVIDKVSLVPMPYAFYRGIKDSLPDVEPKKEDNTELTDEEQKQMMAEAIETENNEKKED